MVASGVHFGDAQNGHGKPFMVQFSSTLRRGEGLWPWKPRFLQNAAFALDPLN